MSLLGASDAEQGFAFHFTAFPLFFYVNVFDHCTHVFQHLAHDTAF